MSEGLGYGTDKPKPKNPGRTLFSGNSDELMRWPGREQSSPQPPEGGGRAPVFCHSVCVGAGGAREGSGNDL